MRRGAGAALLVLAAIASPRTARAQGDDDAGAGAVACADGAERGEELRDAAKLVEARELFVACAQRECPKAVRESCAEWLADVERRIPSIVVNARDAAGRDVSAVRATIDGAPLPPSVVATAARVDPGPHAMRYEADGFAPIEERVILREGEGVRVLPVTFRSAVAAAPHAARPARPTALTWALGGTAVVSLGVFTVFGLMGVSDYRTLDRDCAPRCSQDRIDGVRDKFVVADVGLVVGILAAGGALASYLLSGSPPPRRAASP